MGYTREILHWKVDKDQLHDYHTKPQYSQICMAYGGHISCYQSLLTYGFLENKLSAIVTDFLMTD